MPTIFADLLRYADEHASSTSLAAHGGLRRLGGAARARWRRFEERHGVRDRPGLGDDRDEPVATVARPPRRDARGRAWELRATQGQPVPFVELRIVDDDGDEVPWDGSTTGEIEVRGPWVAARYYNDDDAARQFDDGWLRTGDIARDRRATGGCRSPTAPRT